MNAQKIKSLIQRAFDAVDSKAHSTVTLSSSTSDTKTFSFTFHPSWEAFRDHPFWGYEVKMEEIADTLELSLKENFYPHLSEIELRFDTSINFQYEVFDLGDRDSWDNLSDYEIQGTFTINSESIKRRNNPMATGTLLALGIGYFLGNK